MSKTNTHQKFILAIDNLFKFYKATNKEYVILKELYFKVKSKELIGIVGPSGSGKTTFLNIITLIEPFNFGKIYLEGRDVSTIDYKDLQSYKQTKIGRIWQNYSNLFPSLTIKKNIFYMALLGGLTYEKALDETDKIIKEFNFERKSNQYPLQLSGGERQIASLLSQLVKKPTLLLADEPTSRVDSTNTKQIIDFLKILQENYKTTIIVTTHDKIVAENVDKCYMLNNGNLELK